jgi:hypothetical protein
MEPAFPIGNFAWEVTRRPSMIREDTFERSETLTRPTGVTESGEIVPMTGRGTHASPGQRLLAWDAMNDVARQLSRYAEHHGVRVALPEQS